MFQDFEYGVITLYDETFQTLLLSIHTVMAGPTTPQSKLRGLVYSAFARRY